MTAEARARGLPDIVERLREWSAADMDTHASLRRNGAQVAEVPWSRHGTDLAETVLDAATYIERLRAAQAWQPIATAPRDGTLVLVWVAAGHGMPGFPAVARYEEYGGWCVDELRETTHWRPLPDAPA